MDPQKIPSFEIPKNQGSQPEMTPASFELDTTMSIESTKEILPAPHISQTPISTTATQHVAPTHLVMASDQAQADDAHLIADDVDVIEKEWVEKAKKVISLTSNDPYVEAKELGKLKISYMKKRFNKELPIQEDKRKP